MKGAALLVAIGLSSIVVAVSGRTTVRADSTSPRLAAYYDLKLVLCGETAFQWRGGDRPQPIATGVTQVGVGRDVGYALNKSAQLLALKGGTGEKQVILDQAVWFSAGRSGVFASRSDRTFVYLARSNRWFSSDELAQPEIISTAVTAASIGDSADYFVTRAGDLMVKGLAHRGQYGDGKLRSSETFIPVANDVVAVKAHTGHAIMLKKDGTVWGTGGNIYGPLGHHGIGDKAISWGRIFTDASAIATGSSHSVAVRRGGSMWHWGRDIGLEPMKILDEVIAAAADQRGTIALRRDNSLWQWDRGQQPAQHFQCP